MGSFTKRHVLMIGMCLLLGVGLSMLYGCGSLPTTVLIGDHAHIEQKTVVATSTHIKATRHSSSKKSAPKSIAKLIEEDNHGK